MQFVNVMLAPGPFIGDPPTGSAPTGIPKCPAMLSITLLFHIDTVALPPLGAVVVNAAASITGPISGDKAAGHRENGFAASGAVVIDAAALTSIRGNDASPDDAIP